jgi:small subunit ribosomal protein S8
MLDPISDMLTRIRNAQRAGHTEVLIPMSKLKKKIAELMQEKKYVGNVSEKTDGNKKIIKINLKYLKDEKGKSVAFIQGLKRISRQGQRIYAKKDQIPFVKSGYGTAIVSTSKGLMADSEARRTGLGGEVICEIW